MHFYGLKILLVLTNGTMLSFLFAFASQVKEKANNLVLFDQDTYEKLYKEAPKYKLITPSILAERLHINGSLARMAIKELMAKDEIRMVSQHSSQLIYTRATNI